MIKFLQGRNQNDILNNNCKLNKGKQKIIKDGKLTYINEMTNLSSQNILIKNEMKQQNDNVLCPP
jgi:hypothetical protein